jgi:3-methyladenine DNA glycosylase/8-oxoguanine DNA glycosylase
MLAQVLGNAPVPRLCPAGLAEAVTQHGLAEKLLAQPGAAFTSLAKAILFQQLAGAAAAAIHARFLAACGVRRACLGGGGRGA